MALELTRETTEYMRQRYSQVMAGLKGPMEYPLHWTYQYLHECNHAVEIIKEAHNNRMVTEWDADDYVDSLTSHCTGRNEKTEQKLVERFPPIFQQMRLVDVPCSITDNKGRVLLWYMPGALLKSRQVHMWGTLPNASSTFAIQQGTSWRTNFEYYRTKEEWLAPGTVTMSPAWFQQAHERTNSLEVSASLCKAETVKWLGEQIECLALIGGVLSIIHPKLYEAGIEAQMRITKRPEQIHKGEHLESIRRRWSSPFGVMSIISNRDTPLHRDNGAAHPWYDVLMPLGDYSSGWLNAPGLGLRFRYHPGCLVALSARVVQHGVECEGDRAVVAYYMKSTIFTKLGITHPSWSTE